MWRRHLDGDVINCQLLFQPDPHAPARRVPQRRRFGWTDAGFQVVDRRQKERKMQSERRETMRKSRRDETLPERKQTCSVERCVPGLRVSRHQCYADGEPMRGDRSSRGQRGHRDRGRHRLTAECPDQGRQRSIQAPIPNLGEKKILGVSYHGRRRDGSLRRCAMPTSHSEHEEDHGRR